MDGNWVVKAVFGLETVNPIMRLCQLSCAHTKIIKMLTALLKAAITQGFSWSGARNKSLRTSWLPPCSELEAILFCIITIYNVDRVEHLGA